MRITQVGNVKFIVSGMLRAPHAFSTRVGGVSELSYTGSLNLAFRRGDSEKTVLKNLEIFADAVGFEPESTVSLHQIHSADVMLVDERHRGLGYYKSTELSCDGYATASLNITLGVKTADCVPILLEARNENGEVIAVAAVHAGWRGTASRIAREGVRKLISLGARPENIYAAIGPSIGQCCFEVGRECRDELARIDEKFIKKGNFEKFFPDLAHLNKRVLTDAGVPAENIDIAGLCTYCESELFYSHRRQNGVRGSMLSVIKMK